MISSSDPDGPRFTGYVSGGALVGGARCGRVGVSCSLVERLNEEIQRRTRVTRLFPNEASYLRLVSAVVMEIAEEWQTADKRYLTF